MNEKIQEMIADIELRGGKIGFDADMPDEVLEAFLQQVLECPECAAAVSALPAILPKNKGMG